jgi:hypothetical protein
MIYYFFGVVFFLSLSLPVSAQLSFPGGATPTDELEHSVSELSHVSDEADDVGAAVLVFTTGATILKKISKV